MVLPASFPAEGGIAAQVCAWTTCPETADGYSPSYAGANLQWRGPRVWACKRGLLARRSCRVHLSAQQTAGLQLRGGGDSYSSLSAMPENEAEKWRAIEAEWDQWGREWEYCMQADDEGIGRCLNPDPVPYDDPYPDDPGGPEILNLDGQTPGPHVWQNPPEHCRAEGWVIDPSTAPVPLVIEHGLKRLEEQWAREMRERKYGEDISHLNLPTLEQEGPEGLPQLCWDRDGGTRPFINLRDQVSR